jgi:2'-5' RNA ligase
MADAAGDYAPLALKIGGIGFFPSIKRPRVVWAGLVGEIPNLINLHRNLEDRLAAIGFAKEKRSFKAHLTLGRMKQKTDPDAVRRALKEYLEIGDHQFVADRITLFKSVLKPSGAVYSVLKQSELVE